MCNKVLRCPNIYDEYVNAWANSVDPDQMPQNAVFDKSRLCLPLIQKCLDTWACTKMNSRFSSFFLRSVVI